MEDLFKWIIGGLVSITTGAVGWLGHMLFRDKEEIAHLQARIAVLEARPTVDPVEYMKVITHMGAAISHLTAQIQEATRSLHEVKDELRQIAAELDQLVRQTKGPSR